MTRDGARDSRSPGAWCRAAARARLSPVGRRARWIRGGLVLQALAVAIPIVVVLERAHKEGTLGQITSLTVRLGAKEMLHSRGDLALLVLGVVLFAAGSVVLARPFVTRLWTLVVAVPLAAIIGILAVGVLALVLAAVLVLDDVLDGADLPSFGWLDRAERRAGPGGTAPPGSP